MRYLSLIYFLCIIGEALPQYANIVNETVPKEELTYCYKYVEENELLYSISTIVKDTNVTGSGPNFIEFKIYDEQYNIINSKIYGDSMFRYTGFYGFEKYKNCFYHCGTKGIYNSPSDTLKGFVIKYDTLGNVIWEKNYYTNDENVKIGFMASDDSLIYLLTNVYNPSTTNEIYTMLTAIDSSGTIVWDMDFSGLSQQAKSIRLTSDGGFLISVSSAVTGNVTKTIVYKLDAQHNMEWSKTLGPATKDHYLQFFEMPNGNFLGIGQSDDEITGRERAWLVELNSINGDVNKDTIYVVSPI